MQAEVWVLVDSAGDYACGTSREDAVERYESDVQSLSDANGFRLVCMNVNVPIPEIETVDVDIPAQGPATVTLH